MAISYFVNSLAIELIDDCYWKLLKPLEYHSEMFGDIIVPVDFETDLASVPRLPIIFDMWGARVHREAVLHDFLYCRDCPFPLTYGQSNAVFYEAMTSRHVKFLVKYPMYLAVCAVGMWHFHKRSYFDKLGETCYAE